MLKYSFCGRDYFEKLKNGLHSNQQLSEVVDSVSTLLKEYPFKDPKDSYVVICDDLSGQSTKDRDTLVNTILVESTPIKTLDKVFGILYKKVPIILVIDSSNNPTVITHQSRVKTLENLLGTSSWIKMDLHCRRM